MERYLAGRRAIITGGIRGIGLGIARRIAERGAEVIVWDLNVTSPEADGDEFKPALVQRVDVSSAKEVQAAFDAVVEQAGPVDILVNNAGINGPVTPSWEYPVETWEKVIGINLNGVFHCCRAAIPHMRARGYGRIINVASIAGKEGVQFISAYSAAKGGVIAFTKAVAKELAQDGILINCVAPAMVETALLSQMTEEHIRASKAKLPMGRLLKVDEVASMVSWIAGPECSFTTGFVFDLTGGRATY
ncbi:3-oxoacyl-ACP reductase [Bradyrhizobium centrolobii]|uniref:3-oxoacyl-ACP reductase n=1 Tax=Bradyrhizobium centrolobii TaxID=1505087 RepID=A0A176YG22_9BRAD|nr:SDR family NAD(P)-dependent oxidoreductase [Bradyrhizobium centrolobii]OAF05584.1 3-oxoacyl-ACP reductase [Bradyrhizobium centrolobii]